MISWALSAHSPGLFLYINVAVMIMMNSPSLLRLPESNGVVPREVTDSALTPNWKKDQTDYYYTEWVTVQ